MKANSSMTKCTAREGISQRVGLYIREIGRREGKRVFLSK
jgi:hypothetical protein